MVTGPKCLIYINNVNAQWFDKIFGKSWDLGEFDKHPIKHFMYVILCFSSV